MPQCGLPSHVSVRICWVKFKPTIFLETESPCSQFESNAVGAGDARALAALKEPSLPPTLHPSNCPVHPITPGTASSFACPQEARTTYRSEKEELMLEVRDMARKLNKQVSLNRKLDAAVGELKQRLNEEHVPLDMGSDSESNHSARSAGNASDTGASRRPGKGPDDSAAQAQPNGEPLDKVSEGDGAPADADADSCEEDADPREEDADPPEEDADPREEGADPWEEDADSQERDTPQGEPLVGGSTGADAAPDAAHGHCTEKCQECQDHALQVEHLQQLCADKDKAYWIAQKELASLRQQLDSKAWPCLSLCWCQCSFAMNWCRPELWPMRRTRRRELRTTGSVPEPKPPGPGGTRGARPGIRDWDIGFP